MRIYLKRNETYPVCAGTASQCARVNFITDSFLGEELRAYVDGKLTLSCPWRGSVSGPGRVRSPVGRYGLRFDLDELRISDMQRDPKVNTQPYRADEHTLLLDRFDQIVSKDRGKATVPERVKAVRYSDGVTPWKGNSVKRWLFRLASRFSCWTISRVWVCAPSCSTNTGPSMKTIQRQSAIRSLKSLVKACHERGLSCYFISDTC